MIYVDGQLKLKAEATVSVYDIGFMLGDGVWEGLRMCDGKWAFLGELINRWCAAANAIDLDIGMDRNGVLDALKRSRLVNRMAINAHGRLMVTRGIKHSPFWRPAMSR